VACLIYRSQASLDDEVPVLNPEQEAVLKEWFEVEYRRIRGDFLTHGFPPYAAQELVHASSHEFILMIAANRAGKSTTGMREVLWCATMTHPYKENYPMDTIWVGFPDFGFYRRVTRELFLQWCPKSKLIQFHETEKWATVQRADGGICTIHFLSYDSEREKWQGASVDLCWMDEECPEDVYREAMARLIDRNGRMLMTLTPVSGMGWIYDRIYLPGVNKTGKVEVHQLALAEFDDTQECDVGRSLVPHLNREQILRFARAIPDEDERAIRIFGEFRARSGIVYKQFRPDTHLIPAFDIPMHWELWCGIDPGYHGFACVLFAMSDEGRVVTCGEYFSQEESIRVRAQGIWQMVQKVRKLDIRSDDYITLYVDTEDPQLVTEMNIWAQEHGVPLAFKSLEQGHKARKAGITRVQEMLDLHPDRQKPKWVKRERDQRGEPLLYLFDNLHSNWRMDEEVYAESRIVWEIVRYLWKKPPKDTPHPLDADERTAGGAHALAAFRYGVMARMSPAASPSEDILSTLGLDERSLRAWQHLRDLENENWVVE
jgi:phage terminase large subunit-like protein